MARATISDVRDALAAVCATVIPRSSAEILPKPEPPALCVRVEQVTYGNTFDGALTIAADLWTYVSPQDLVRSQRALDAYMAPEGATSLKVAIEADPSLGGVVDYTRVMGWLEGARLVDVAGSQLLAAALRVEVML